MKSNENSSNVPKKCPKCGKPLEIRHGEYGTYLDCIGYPKCKFTQDMSKKIKPKGVRLYEDKVRLPVNCPKCTKKLAVYIGVNGAFFGCNGYPTCNFSRNVDDLDNIVCSKCGNLMTERTGKYGLFLGCRSYPECKFTFPIRVSKTVKSQPEPEVKAKKKLDLGELQSPLSTDAILNLFSTEWLNIKQIILNLNAKDENDIKYLSLKLDELERKKVLTVKLEEGYKYWKKSGVKIAQKEKKIIKEILQNYVYILKLENEKWWVGRTKKLSSGITVHKDGQGSSWTRDNRVIDTEEIIENGDLTDITLDYMKKYGWENVKGTCFNESYYIYIPKKIKVYIKGQTGGLEFFKEKEEALGPKFVYILKLEHGKWYVGRSINVERRVKEMKEEGNTWTQMHKILGVGEVIENGDLKQITLDYMRKYGWENVRGYAWSQWNMKNPPKELRK